MFLYIYNISWACVASIDGPRLPSGSLPHRYYCIVLPYRQWIVCVCMTQRHWLRAVGDCYICRAERTLLPPPLLLLMMMTMTMMMMMIVIMFVYLFSYQFRFCSAQSFRSSFCYPQCMFSPATMIPFSFQKSESALWRCAVMSNDTRRRLAVSCRRYADASHACTMRKTCADRLINAK